MDYVDYKNYMYKTWERDKKSHKNRVKVILASPSNRINNKPGSYLLNPPCKHKKEKVNQEDVHNIELYFSSLKQILEKDVHTPLKSEINRMSSLGYIPKNFKKKNMEREVDDENWRIFQRLSKVKSCFSTRKWEKDFKDTISYKKLISKPHLEKKLPSISQGQTARRTLIDSYSIASFNN